MQYVGKAVDVAATLIEAFRSGNLPKAMAPIFIRRKDGIPCRSWSWGNQLLCVIYGTSDARGIRQWNECGRGVKKGSKAFDILVPLLKPAKVIDETTKQEKRIEVLVGLGQHLFLRWRQPMGRNFRKQMTKSFSGLTHFPWWTLHVHGA